MTERPPLPREERLAAIRAALQGAFAPSLLEVRDDSLLHAGHAGARDGRGHFHVEIVSESFKGLSSLARHRAIYGVLADLMTTDIHALSIHARCLGDPPQVT